ncbi:MAG: hypothetical protein EA369_09395 [Bradymonadales bacterium]|nr:MAG: hypothetical protein EA369_09395 [Bradymonadales bacterium]
MSLLLRRLHRLQKNKMSPLKTHFVFWGRVRNWQLKERAGRWSWEPKLLLFRRPKLRANLKPLPQRKWLVSLNL